MAYVASNWAPSKVASLPLTMLHAPVFAASASACCTVGWSMVFCSSFKEAVVRSRITFASFGRVPQRCGEYRRPQNPVNCPLSRRGGEGLALVSPLVYDPRARWALRWLFVRVSLPGATPGRPPPRGPAPPTRTRSTEPEAVEGLPPPPPGALWER